MTLGLPYDLFARDILVVMAYATAAVVCATRWQQGPWARVGAAAAALGAALQAFALIAWVAFANGVRALMDFRTQAGIEDALGWLHLLPVVGVLAAVLMDRGAHPGWSRERPARRSSPREPSAR